jgi:hypothetical protein
MTVRAVGEWAEGAQALRDIERLDRFGRPVAGMMVVGRAEG